MDKPKFSVSEITTFHQTFAQDLETYAAAGAEGIGVWEFKLAEDRDDTEALAAVADAGLKATTCIPDVSRCSPSRSRGRPTRRSARSSCAGRSSASPRSSPRSCSP